METQLKHKFQKVVEAVTLKEVILISSKCKSHFHYSVVNPSQTKLEFIKQISKPNISTSKDKKNRILITHIEFTVNGKPKENLIDLKIKKDNLLFSISVSYLITYTIKNIGSLDQEMLELFGQDNAFFNVYPYLREYISHMSTRLNIPPVILPLLKPSSQLRQKRSTSQKKPKKKTKK